MSSNCLLDTETSPSGLIEPYPLPDYFPISFTELFNLFVAAGVLRDPGGPAVVTRLAELVWLISEFWLVSVEVSGEMVDAAQTE